MRLVGIFIVACVVIAAAQAIAAALVLLGIVYALFHYPRPTLAVIGLALAISMFEAHPVGFIVVIALLATATITFDRRTNRLTRR